MRLPARSTAPAAAARPIGAPRAVLIGATGAGIAVGAFILFTFIRRRASADGRRSTPDL